MIDSAIYGNYTKAHYYILEIKINGKFSYIGHLALYPYNRKYWIVNHIVILPPFQRKGYGSFLWEKIKSKSKKFLAESPNYKMRKLLEKLGEKEYLQTF